MSSGTALLAGLTVVDLTDDRGLMAGRLLADLGAEVVRIPPPGVDRGYDPAYRLAYNYRKRLIFTDLSTTTGKAELISLLDTADVVLQCGPGGALAAVGIDEEQLRSRWPALVSVTITPFGLTGPKSRYVDSDLVVWAASGAMSRNRFGGRVPVRVSVRNLSYMHACADAVIGVLLAYHGRLRSGRGQHVEVSAQASLNFSSLKMGLYPLVNDVMGPPGSGVSAYPTIWRSRDGFVHFTLTTGPATGHFSNAFVRWLKDIGALRDDFPEVDWTTFPQSSGSGLSASSADRADGVDIPPSERAELIGAIARAFETRSNAELFAVARQRELLVAPIMSIDQILADDHLLARGFWYSVDYDGRTARIPGLPFVASDSGAPARTASEREVVP